MNTRLSRAPSGKIATQRTISGSGRFNYEYDYAGRLLSSYNPEWQGFGQTFSYNAAGSIMSKSDVGAYVYPSPAANRPHAPITVAGQTLTYDANGNMLQGYDGKVMTYDAENRPLSVTHNGLVTHYVYGADGSRLLRIEGDSATVTFGPVEIRDFGKPTEAVLTYPHPAVRLENGVASYLHRDHLGSVRSITNAAGVQMQQRTYRPYGETWQQQSVVFTDETKGWIGERFDAGAGLMYLNARYYDPELGLFLQPDWFEVTKAGVGTNRYAYAGGDPVNALDPGGNETWKGKIANAIADFVSRGGDDATRSAARQASEAVLRRGERELREQARRQAWDLEIELVQRTTRGTHDWTATERRYLLRGERVPGYVGHHINGVATDPNLMGDPRNIKFVKPGRNHLHGEHNGDYRAPVRGVLIDRAAMLSREGFDVPDLGRTRTWSEYRAEAVRAGMSTTAKVLSSVDRVLSAMPPDAISMGIDYIYSGTVAGQRELWLQYCSANPNSCT